MITASFQLKGMNQKIKIPQYSYPYVMEYLRGAIIFSTPEGIEEQIVYASVMNFWKKFEGKETLKCDVSKSLNIGDLLGVYDFLTSRCWAYNTYLELSPTDYKSVCIEELIDQIRQILIQPNMDKLRLNLNQLDQ